MKCQKCLKDFEERDIQESHDIPKYMFNGDKNIADKYGRHQLCQRCHDIYEKIVFSIVFKSLSEEQKLKSRQAVKSFSIYYFKKEEIKKDDTTKIE